MADKNSIKINFHRYKTEDTNSNLPLPPVLLDENRSSTESDNEFINDSVVKVEAVYELSSVARDAAEDKPDLVKDDHILALETDDDTVIFISASKLQQDMQRLFPNKIKKGGTLDLALLNDRDAVSRGVSDYIWKKVSILSLVPDGVAEKAKQKALQWVQEKLGDKFKEQALELVEGGASRLGAKALMAGIESKLAGKQGLYRWHDSELSPSDRVVDDAWLKQEAKKGAFLIFIHGTASSTEGSFKHLRKDYGEMSWDLLTESFANRIFGFEHYTFSQSPIENAIALAKVLPTGARISLVTHSRGGQVGDLLCSAGMDDGLIEQYYRPAAPLSKNNENKKESDAEKALRELVCKEEQQQLRELSQLLDKKNFQIERYVRVACPAAGTTLLSDNLDVFLSSLLSLMKMVVGNATGPIGNSVFASFKRIVLEIAQKRIDPRMIPGIEAMLIDAPMSRLLANMPRKQGINMAVITGDSEGGNILKRIAVMFTDWMFFDKNDNDLVVDTTSMSAGLASSHKTMILFDSGAEVNHFSYFKNERTRINLCAWLNHAEPETLQDFQVIGVAEIDSDIKPTHRSAGDENTLPVVILIPGIMGSHLERRSRGASKGSGNRIWLDYPHLAIGGLSEISISKPTIHSEGLVGNFYSDLIDYLQASHRVIPFDYDWRQPIADNAKLLADKLRVVLDETKQPIRIMAHSMGGLLTRQMIIDNKTTWEKFAERTGSRFIMLGTPNHGAHSSVDMLLNKDSVVRNLARLDFRHSAQDVIDIICEFSGALELLPAPKFVDTAGKATFNYYDTTVWSDLKNNNIDRWFGDKIGGKPKQAKLDKAKQFWTNLATKEKALFSSNGMDKSKFIYVYGCAKQTPCGLKQKGKKLLFLKTVQGDGTVTWQSGKLDWLPEDQHYYMQAEHGALASTKAHFPALLELLKHGETKRLSKNRPVMRTMEVFTHIEAPPTPLLGEREFIRSMTGKPLEDKSTLNHLLPLILSVRAMDLRDCQNPLICGHYAGDTIAGTEKIIDQSLVDGALSYRSRLGIYASDVCTSTIVLMKQNEEEKKRDTVKGTLIVGLGDWDNISTQKIADTVRDGVLRYLLEYQERNESDEVLDVNNTPIKLKLGSLLIGCNSTTHISIESSVDAIVKGVCGANRQYKNVIGKENLPHIGELEFIEYYLDTAISAAHAVATVTQRLDRDFQRLQMRVQAEQELQFTANARSRLRARGEQGYWARLMIKDGDSDADKQLNNASKYGLSDKLEYVFLAERARAEAQLHQRQPGLIEALIKRAIKRTAYDTELSRTLFQLMIPLDLKATIRQTERLLLILDGYTANLPWEMMQVDDGEPLAIKAAIVRQFVTLSYRRNISSSPCKHACVIGNPSTRDFYQHFKVEGVNKTCGGLASLSGATIEAKLIDKQLKDSGYATTSLYPLRDRSLASHTAVQVFNTLFKHAYRILVIAAHGVVNVARRHGGKRQTGVVLSDGAMLTAAEIGQMEVVPELVFLNCCHLAKVDKEAIDESRDFNKLAYSLSRQLIEMGVRCVITAGWAVDDQAASVFSASFFKSFVKQGKSFGDAVWQARKDTYNTSLGLNTWGAYQAYGDPAYRLDPEIEIKNKKHKGKWKSVAPHELVEQLRDLRIKYKQNKNLTVKDVDKAIDDSFQNAPIAWHKLPAIQLEIAKLYGALGLQGFDKSRKAYEKLIVEKDNAGIVPVQAIEQLANFEARTGEKKAGAEGLALIEKAIKRIKGLLSSTEASVSDQTKANIERYAILGSAYKRKAAVLLKMEKPWSEIRLAIQKCKEAYRQGEDTVELQGDNIYTILNRIQLDALLSRVSNEKTEQANEYTAENKEADRILAQRCQEEVRKRFEKSYDFYDAAMSGDAKLAILLINAELVTKKSIDSLFKRYKNAIKNVPAHARQISSVIEHLELMAGFIKKRNSTGDDKRAAGLNNIVKKLQEEFE